MHKVLTRVKDYISFEFANLVTTQEYFALDFQQLKLVLSSDVLFNISCDDKAKGCVSWMTHSQHASTVSKQDLYNHFALVFSKQFYDLQGMYGFLININNYIDTMSVMDPSCSKLGHVTEGCTMLALGADEEAQQKDTKLFKIDFQNDTVNEIGSLPQFFQGENAFCSTPYGIFAIQIHSTHILCGILDIHSFNYLRLPDFPYYKPMHKARVWFVDGKVYVLGQYKTKQTFHCLDFSVCGPWKSELEYIVDTTIRPEDNISQPPLSAITHPCGVDDKLYFVWKQLMRYNTNNVTAGSHTLEMVPGPFRCPKPWMLGVVAVGREVRV
jgi:hypothetical protein